MRKKSLFYKKVKCFHCGGGCKKKKERGKSKYICSNYDNYGKCQRIIIDEDKLIKAINRRFRREVSEDEIKNIVSEVIIKNSQLFDIILTEGNPISYHERGIVF